MASPRTRCVPTCRPFSSWPPAAGDRGLLRGWSRALLVPAALYGTALVGRLIGVASGDMVNGGIVQAMIIEALSVGLMITAYYILSRASAAASGVEISS